MQPKVGLHSPAHLLTDRDLLEEVLPGLRLTLILLQRFPQVAHVPCSAQLGDPRQQHDGEESDEQAGVRAQGQVCLGTGVLMWAETEGHRHKSSELLWIHIETFVDL